jgi:ribosomal protein S18 acetylase RimI-like enzyme
MPLLPEEYKAIREIFFMSSSRQTFASEEEREKFFTTWTEYYFKFCPELILLDRDGDKVRGYLMGCVDSMAAEEFYRERLKSYSVFADLFPRFPAHLHINVHPTGRSQGVGGRLIGRFAALLKSQGALGVHIVTSPDSANREFYRRNGFEFEEIRPWQKHSLLFMGRTF